MAGIMNGLLWRNEPIADYYLEIKWHSLRELQDAVYTNYAWDFLLYVVIFAVLPYME